MVFEGIIDLDVDSLEPSFMDPFMEWIRDSEMVDCITNLRITLDPALAKCWRNVIAACSTKLETLVIRWHVDSVSTPRHEPDLDIMLGFTGRDFNRLQELLIDITIKDEEQLNLRDFV